MKHPNDPTECRKVLFDIYGKLMDKKIKEVDWEVFSGSFNRHIHDKIRVCGGRKQKLFRFLYSMWQSLNRMRHYQGKLLMIPKAHRERQHLTLLKEGFREALDDC